MSWQKRSEKIRTLIHEGYEPRQAMAIAYRMVGEVDPPPSERAAEIMRAMEVARNEGRTAPEWMKQELADELAGRPEYPEMVGLDMQRLRGDGERLTRAKLRERLAHCTAGVEVCRAQLQGAEGMVEAASSPKSLATAQKRREKAAIALTKAEQKMTRALEAVQAHTASGEPTPIERAVRAVKEDARTVGPPDPLRWMIDAHGAGDDALGGGYTPTASVLGKREENRQRKEIQDIGNLLFGAQFASEQIVPGELWTTYRDNRDRKAWREKLNDLASAFELAGYIVKRDEDGRPSVVFDRDAIARASAIHGDYVAWLRGDTPVPPRLVAALAPRDAPQVPRVPRPPGPKRKPSTKPKAKRKAARNPARKPVAKKSARKKPAKKKAPASKAKKPARRVPKKAAKKKSRR